MRKEIREQLSQRRMTLEQLGGRVVVENGVWKVPESERPPRWRNLNVQEPDVVANPEPRIDTVAERLLDSAVDETNHWAEIMREFKEQVVPGIRAGGKAFGATKEMVIAAKVLMGLCYTRDPNRIGVLAKASRHRVEPIMKIYSDAGLFSYDSMAVHLGIDPEGDIPDLGFWLNSMAGAGLIQITGLDEYGAVKK